MAQSFTDVLSHEELNYLLSAPEVQAAKASIDTRESGQVYFSMQIPATVHQKLQERLGLTLPTTVPMRWVKGDTAPHVDVGPRSFETTHLMYLTDNEGELVVNGTRYPINCGAAYTFSEGLSHETVNTGSVPRLLLGPMSERGITVGRTPPIRYYETQALAEAASFDFIAYCDFFQVGCVTGVGSINGYTRWRIAYSSNGSSSQSVVYQNGDMLLDVPQGNAYYNLYPVPDDNCCPDPVQLIGLSYSVRNDITAGSIISQTPPPRFSSYSAYYQMRKSKSARK
jgi:hypothetical protein